MTSTRCTAGGVAGEVCEIMTIAYTTLAVGLNDRTQGCMHEPGLYQRIMQAPVRAGEGQGHRRSGEQSQCTVEVSMSMCSALQLQLGSACTHGHRVRWIRRWPRRIWCRWCATWAALAGTTTTVTGRRRNPMAAHIRSLLNAHPDHGH